MVRLTGAFVGFLIAAYMVERMDCSVEAAVLAFAQARPPGIYKDDYIKELFRRYDDVEDALPAPEKPSWCSKGNRTHFIPNRLILQLNCRQRL